MERQATLHEKDYVFNLSKNIIPSSIIVICHSDEPFTIEWREKLAGVICTVSTQYPFICNGRDFNEGHKYAEKRCACGHEFCFECCGGTNVHEGGKTEPDYMFCPRCGKDYYQS